MTPAAAVLGGAVIYTETVTGTWMSRAEALQALGAGVTSRVIEAPRAGTPRWLVCGVGATEYRISGGSLAVRVAGLDPLAPERPASLIEAIRVDGLDLALGETQWRTDVAGGLEAWLAVRLHHAAGCREPRRRGAVRWARR